MSVLTQGTHVFFIDPTGTTPEVVKVECATSFNPGGNPSDPVEDTCLEAFERTYKNGLRNPGQASLGLNADPQYASHVKMHELNQENPQRKLKWVIGWSDGTAPPTVGTGGGFELPESRTWFEFEGHISDFPFDFQQNTVVKTEATIQRSGGSKWTPKVVTT